MSRSLNELENLFVDLNIRFAIGVRYKNDTTGDRFRSLVQVILDTHPLFACKITTDAEANILSKRTSEQSIHPISLARTARESESLLQDALYEVVHSYKGVEDVHVTIFTNEALHEHTVIFNFCHALIDARGAADLLGALTASLKTTGPFGHCPQTLSTYTTQDFSKLIPEIEVHDDVDAQCLSQSVLKYGDVFGNSECSDSGDATISIDSQNAVRIHSNLRQHSATFTGLWLWAIFKTMSELISNKETSSTGVPNPQYLSVSVLVDIRSQLNTYAAEQTQQHRTAFGTVSLMRKVDERYDEKDIFCGSNQLTSELKAAVLRGDALRSAKKMCNGDWDDVEKLAGTVELSNHGVYDVPVDGEVAVTQRHDGYRGISIIFWSEKGSKDMKAVASYGGLKEEIVVDFMNRVKEIILMASTV